jgi:hypothetical protein
MALSPSLQQFKSSGVYRLEFDKSQIINIPTETIRLVIGFSKKGPFNTPVLVPDSVFFNAVFGDIDTALERKGSFLHRTVLTCLTRGPVIVLNLLKLTDVDKSQTVSISTSATNLYSPTTDLASVDTLPGATSLPVSSFFNKDKFWFTDPQALLKTRGAKTKKFLLNVANTGRSTFSILTKKATVAGFDILAKEWFGVGKVPEFMNENDYISDYMIDLIIVEGDFSDYKSLSEDPIFSPFFDSKGLKVSYVNSQGIFKKDALTDFLSLAQVNILGVYTGALLPEFQSKNGENLFIQDLVNIETSKTGLLLAFDGEQLDDNPQLISGKRIDLVGHNLEGNLQSEVNFLSYYGQIYENLGYTGNTGNIGYYKIGGSGASGAVAGYSGSVGYPLKSSTLKNRLVNAGFSIDSVQMKSDLSYDTIILFGPSATQPVGYSKLTQGQFDLVAKAADANNLFLSVGYRYAAGGSSITVAAGSTAWVDFVQATRFGDVNNNTISLRLNSLGLSAAQIAAGMTGPSGTFAYYTLNPQVNYAGGSSSTISTVLDVRQMFSNSVTDTIYAMESSDLYRDIEANRVNDNDLLDTSAFGATSAVYKYIKTDEAQAHNFLIAESGTWNAVNAFSSINPIFDKVLKYKKVTLWENADLSTSVQIPSFGAYSPANRISIKSTRDKINDTIDLWAGATAFTHPTTTVWITGGTFPADIIKAGQFLVQNLGGTANTKFDSMNQTRLTRIISANKFTEGVNAGKIKITTNDPIFVNENNKIERYTKIEDFATNYRFHTLKGYTITSAMVPNGTPERQNEILDVMYNTNISAALQDREVILFRYIVDTFEGIIEPAAKVRLSRLAKNQMSSLAICNMPSIKEFRECPNPIFKSLGADGVTYSQFNATYIGTGGNIDLNPSNTFSLPGIADGANYSAFYGPNLVIRENGSNISVPPAAHVSNLFIDKYNLALPFSIVAGPRRGIISGEGLVGVEYAFDRNDLDSIEPFGYNAILNKRGFGLTINANQTAQQTVKSALSQIHVRELLIYIQDGIEAILKNYRWEFNTAQNRLEIKTLADNFLSQILSSGGVYDFQNIMDSSNNTPEIIDNNIGILDTYIEPVRGMGILVHRTTILRTGTIATGNFL